MPRQIPQPILSAAVGMLGPFFPDLTATRLITALEASTAPDQAAPADEALTKAEVCRLSKLSLASVNRRLRDGTLPYRKVGPRLVRIPRSAVESLLLAPQPSEAQAG